MMKKVPGLPNHVLIIQCVFIFFQQFFSILLTKNHKCLSIMICWPPKSAHSARLLLLTQCQENFWEIFFFLFVIFLAI